MNKTSISLSLFLLVVLGVASRASEKLHHDAEAIRKANAAVAQEAPVAQRDSERPSFHLMAPARWINDPVGCFYEDGWYHVFYQHNPYENRWGHMHWGHARSRDNVHWEHLPIAVWPDYDKGEDHCYSGSAVRDGNGNLQLWYTSVSKVRAKDKEKTKGRGKGKLDWVFNGQVMLKPMDKDYIRWGKSTDDPVNAPTLANNIDGYPWNKYIRDPSFFKVGERTFMILGITGKGVPIYEAENKDLTQWKYRGEMYGPNHDCVQMIPFAGDKWVYIYNKSYIAGTFDPDTAKFTPLKGAKLRELNEGGDFSYVGSYAINDQGETSLYTWLKPTGKGWAGCVSLPTRLSLTDDGKLIQKPVAELAKLRGAHAAAAVSGERKAVATGNAVEIKATFKNVGSGKCGLRIGGNDVIYENNSLRLWGHTVQNLKPEGITGALSLQIFIDKCIAEVFINGGKRVVVREFKSSDASHSIEAFAEGGSTGTVDVWQMKAAEKDASRAEAVNTKNQFDNYKTYLSTGYDQPYRPLAHFTSRRNWINDPNGMLYYDGEYHLFFQHNPLGMTWGNMTWGHAISTDMVHWKQMDHALLPYGNGYMFSGTGAVDHNNSLGKQQGDIKTLVMLYSYAIDERDNFGVLPVPSETKYYQGIAYSTDRGRTFKFLNEGLPVIPNQGSEIDQSGTERDPKFFWHEPSQKWVAVLWMGDDSKHVRFFNSDDLQNWTVVSDMKREWAHECFDMVYLDVLDADGNPVASGPKKKWLIYDGNLDYEVGSFDGKTWTKEQEVMNHMLGHWNAAQTFNNSPDGRSVIIGWLPNRSFRKVKMPFEQQLSFPATMHLRRINDKYHLCRWPIKEIELLYGRQWSLSGNRSVAEVNQEWAKADVEASDITIEFMPKAGEDLTFNLRGSMLRYDAAKNQLHFKRYVMKHALNSDGSVRLRILIDRASLEIFLNDGIGVLTHSEVHDLDNRALSIEGGAGAVIKKMELHELTSSWKSPVL
jgi:fructan beta-fructosidase